MLFHLLNSVQEWLDCFAAREVASEQDVVAALEPLKDDTDSEDEVLLLLNSY